jgi:tetratricopeptide (TPR) repeat protein
LGIYIALLCLKYPHDARKDQADYCLLRAVRLGIENDVLLEELGDIYHDKKPIFAISCFDRAIQMNDTRGEIYQKYGTVLLSHKKNEVDKAIDLLKEALEKLKGENKKSHCALILQEALKEEGRDDEAQELAKYIQNNNSTS